MKELIYTIRVILKNWKNNILRITSLTLGFALGLVMISQVTYQLSFDGFLPDKELVYQIRTIYSISGKDMDSEYMNAPMGPTMAQTMPQVEQGTRIRPIGEPEFYLGDKHLPAKTIYADTAFFDVLDFGVLQGDPKHDLVASDQLFVSESFAKRMFGNEDPVGKVLLFNKVTPQTVRGVFRDVPLNSHLAFDVIISFNTIINKGLMRTDWDGGDSFPTYLKLRPGTNINDVQAQLEEYLENSELREELEEFSQTFYFLPIDKVHISDESTKRVTIILGILALVILFISSMNYVLISISSLTKRTKSVAIYKVNGAERRNILGMFLYETGMIILVSVLLSFLLILVFQKPVRELTQTSLEVLFSFDRLWVLGVVVVILFFISGLIPGRIFSSIPVTRAFKGGAANKKVWKQMLLFIQFAGVAFIFVFLLIIIGQYQMMLKRDLGYQYDKLLYQRVQNQTHEQYQKLSSELEALPFVEGTALTSSLYFQGLSGQPSFDPVTNDLLFLCRFTYNDHHYIPLMGMRLLEGENFSATATREEAIVNRKYVEMIGWQDDPIGKTIFNGIVRMSVVGVVENFQTADPKSEYMPVVIHPIVMRDSANYSYFLMIKLREMSPENIQAVNNRLTDLLPDQPVEISVYSNIIKDQLRGDELFRDAVTIASLLTFLIALMGLIGYINDELQRRSKEIAIRKINGATVKEVILLIAREIEITAFVAVVIGIGLAGYIGSNWLERFAVKIPLSPWIFIAGALFVLCVVMVTVVLKCWKIARENPVHSIKSE